MKFNLAILLTSLLLASCSDNIPDATVKITNLQSNSGGSGTIIRSETGASEILTNRHVCGVVKRGGLVHTRNGGVHFVVSYKTSLLHDLCILTVADDLGVNTKVSKRAPDMFEEATVSGHPKLMPNIITKGHFSGRQIIQVLTGFKECTDVEKNNENTALFCMFFGKLPVVENYDAIALSATIQPGSSGSGVYGATKDIGAVVFAGNGDLSYGYAVPYEYVRMFIKAEYEVLPMQYPDVTVDLASMSKPSQKVETEEARATCELLRGHTATDNLCKALRITNLIEYQ